MAYRAIRLKVLVLATLVVVNGAGCSTVAAVLLDVPETAPAQTGAAAPGVQTTPQQAAVHERQPLPVELATHRDSILALLPTDEAGSVDWSAAIRDGIVDPAWQVAGEDKPAVLQGFAFDIRLKGPNEMFDASFPHSSHVEWASCQNCHGPIFEYGGEPITMEAVTAGNACGQCHGPVAFPVSTCVRCHPGMPSFAPVEDPLGGTIELARGAEAQAAAGAFPTARFPHWRHRIRYRCTACHPSPFGMRVGTDTLTMNAMQDGQFCGKCHNSRDAFGLMECTQCHAAPT